MPWLPPPLPDNPTLDRGILLKNDEAVIAALKSDALQALYEFYEEIFFKDFVKCKLDKILHSSCFFVQ